MIHAYYFAYTSLTFVLSLAAANEPCKQVERKRVKAAAEAACSRTSGKVNQWSPPERKQ